MKLEFSRQIIKKYTQISNLMKICQVGTDLFHADQQTHNEADSLFFYITLRTRLTVLIFVFVEFSRLGS
jgi:hypothetical protein